MTRNSTIRISAALAVGALGLSAQGCRCPGGGGDGGNGGADGGSDASGPCIPPVVAWTAPETMDLSGSGFANVLRFAPNGDPWLVTMRANTCDPANACTGSGTCNMMVVSDVCTAGICQGCCNFGGNVAQYEILFVAPDGAGGYTSEVIAAEEYVALTGVAMEIDPANGAPCVAFAGSEGGVAPTLSCGAHDLLYTCRSGGAWGAPATVIAMSDTGDTCQVGQNACNIGDVTGLWPSLAFSAADGSAAIAYRDQHNGWNKIDDSAADLEVALAATGAGGWTASAPWNGEGGGLYPTVTFDLAGEPMAAHDSIDEGVMLTRRVGGTWMSTVASTVPGSERINLAVASDGTIYIAYYTSVAGQGRLSLLTSVDDGMTFTSTTIDTDGVTGQTPSFRIAPDGTPTVAYYRCSDASSSCELSEDDLKFAYLSCGNWQRMSVTGVADPSTSAGLWPSLDYDADGNPGIAYQESWSDPGGALYRVTRIVRGTW